MIRIMLAMRPFSVTGESHSDLAVRTEMQNLRGRFSRRLERKHDVCLKAAGSDHCEHSEITHRPEEIERWARGVQERFAGKPIAVCLEIARGPLVYALQRYEFLVLFPVNPSTLASYRETFC